MKIWHALNPEKNKYPCEEITRVDDTSSQYADVCINEAGSHLLNALRGFVFGCADAVCRWQYDNGILDNRNIRSLASTRNLSGKGFDFGYHPS